LRRLKRHKRRKQREGSVKNLKRGESLRRKCENFRKPKNANKQQCYKLYRKKTENLRKEGLLRGLQENR